MSTTFHSKAELAKTCCRVSEKQRQAQAKQFLAFLVSNVTANSTKRSLWVALVRGCVGENGYPPALLAGVAHCVKCSRRHDSSGLYQCDTYESKDEGEILYGM